VVGDARGRSAYAQCGTKASSCKTCHEVQGKLKSEYPKALATSSIPFGDFCVFCHAGDTKPRQSSRAIKACRPTRRLGASCARAHESDCKRARREIRASFGCDAGPGSGGSSTPRGPTPLLPFVAKVARGGSTLDLAGTALFVGSSGLTESQHLPTSQTVNWGNVTLAALALVLSLGGGSLVF